MRFMRIFAFLMFLVPFASFGATNEFMVAAQLLSAAKNADIQQVQLLINDGADVNYVDSTGLSIVCTALMNNDLRAAQILQMYGADASKCDRQIKQYNSRNKPKRTGGLFGGLSSAQSITLAAAGAAVVVGGLFLLTDLLDPGNDNKSSSSGGSHGGGGGGGGGSTPTPAFTLPYGPAMTDAAAEKSEYTNNLNFYSPADESSSYYKNYTLMNNSAMNQNYLLMMHGYSAMARGYNGMRTLRYMDTGHTPVPKSILDGHAVSGYVVEGGRPVNVALITTNGINMHGKPAGEYTAAVDSLDDRLVAWTQLNGSSVVEPEYTNLASKYYNNAITFGSTAETKVADSTTAEDETMVELFDLSGNGTAVENADASDYDNLLAKVVGGANSGFSNPDYMGFMPNGQMTIFRTGGGVDVNGDPTDYYNYKALRNAASLYMAGDSGARSRPDIFANASVIEPLHATDAPTVSTLLSVNPDITDKSVYNVAFTAYVNSTYGDDDGTYQPGTDSYNFFYNLGSAYLPLVLFSTGAVETDSYYSGEAVDATFENAAPIVYDNLEHLFASIVAVGQKGATPYSGNIANYSPSGKYVLTQWQNTNGTPDDASDDTYYRARMCGIAGMGINGIDPWCFAAVGITDELAVASAAGAFGAMKSAFPYLDNKQIFALAALTADGAYLGTLDGKSASKEALAAYLQGLYELPYEYQAYVDGNEMDYLDAFKLVFGYGVINVERATTPGKSIYYYNGNDIVSTSGNAYWRMASNTAFRASSAFGGRDATLHTAAFDVLTSIDGELSLPRVWTNEFALGANSKHGLYMGDVLGELKTRDDEQNRVQIGQMGFSMTTSQRAYNDNMGGLDNMKLDWQSGNWNFAGGYQRYFTDGASRFAGLNNPILGLASNAVVSDAKYDFGNWSFGARAFSGNITDESLVEHDPTVAAMYEPARLGFMHGASTSMAWNGKRFGFNTTIGTANETNTVLGAYTDGLLNMGAGQTVYVDNEITFRPIDKLKLTARATFARTTTDGAGNLVLGVSPLESNAFAIGADWGNFRFSVAQPLAVRHGALRYAYADYDVIDTDDGNFALNIVDTHVAEIDLSAKTRELRFTGEYRHNFGEFTDGALGFIYRVNPNNTNEFGNESIFMMKMTHRVGI